jgi:hypothetical protein
LSFSFLSHASNSSVSDDFDHVSTISDSRGRSRRDVTGDKHFLSLGPTWEAKARTAISRSEIVMVMLGSRTAHHVYPQMLVTPGVLESPGDLLPAGAVGPKSAAGQSPAESLRNFEEPLRR